MAGSIQGDPGAVEAAADDLARAASWLDEAGQSVGSHGRQVTANWSGSASEAALAHITDLSRRADSGAATMQAAAPVLREYAQQLRAAQRAFAAGEARAEAGRAAGHRADADARALLSAIGDAEPTGGQQQAQDAARRAQVAAEREVQAGEAAMAAAAQQAEAANARAAARIRDLTGQLDGMTGGQASTDTVAPPPPPPPPKEHGFWSGLGHGVLDVAGLVPVIGEPADGINAAWYAAEGDKANAALSAAAMVPGLGWGATATKFGVKAGRSGKKADDVAEGLTTAQSAAPVGPSTGTHADRYKKHLDESHLDAARRELNGEVVKVNPKDGEPFDHVTEVRNAQAGLLKRIKWVKRKMDSGDLSEAEREALEEELSELSKLLDHTEGYVPR